MPHNMQGLPGLLQRMCSFCNIREGAVYAHRRLHCKTAFESSGVTPRHRLSSNEQQLAQLR